MKGWLKWLGALIGFSIFGYFGGIVGFLVGSMFDNRTASNWDEHYAAGDRYTGQQAYQRSSTGDFAASLLVLTAAVMKADGKVLKSELNFISKTTFLLIT